MKRILLEILACPKCLGAITAIPDGTNEIVEGRLDCQSCSAQYPVNNGIPRFIEPDNYASSFGYQWNLFRKEQIDSHNGTDLSAKRFWSETGWTKEELKGKWLLDAGCGAGRFVDVASTTEAQVVGVDISNAIDAAQENLKGRENVHFVQASIYELPFRKEIFDGCYCIGVIQHTPNPEKTLRSLAEMVKKDGKIAVTIYDNRRWYTKLFSKYWLRPVTKRMPQESLLKIIKAIMPVAFPLTDVLFRLPLLGKSFMFIIPVANYVHEKQLSREQRYSWAVLDTFDMLSPQFDSPMKEAEVSKILSESGINEITRFPNQGLNVVGKRKPTTTMNDIVK
jgi:2-polyprenyl-3-methyl-5-hydroxy-6-metoxy-1,4-benzoquinol methylase